MKIEVQIGCEFGYADFFGKFVFCKQMCIVYAVAVTPPLGA